MANLCDFPLQVASDGVASISCETRRFQQIGRIVEELECRLQQRTWLNRRTYRKAVLQKRPGTLLGLEEQWRLECQVAERIAETAGRPVDLHFRLTLLHNAVETERLCIFLAAEESSNDLQKTSASTSISATSSSSNMFWSKNCGIITGDSKKNSKNGQNG
ncbi:uncharacterized protein LOC129602302 [Paramacrobiotus metropolitanus]|uniref:uncharacterized protein LOC129602302 n=1 Tax=Paramacrobiotus metropolitanus TaxID=2943436 RepID=UPI002445A502|nr:uncharacterized protein LOC129602302 [Paramacrobiotus metropolitanus]